MQKGNLLAASLAWSVLLIAVISVAVSWYSQGIVWTILRTDLDAADKVTQVRIFFEGFGVWAPLVYVACVTVEVVVAPIPGLMLYAPGGVVFGGFLGGLLSLIGNTLGAGICCAAVRGFGQKWLQGLAPDGSLAATQGLLERRGAWLILLLRANPLTSSDLISYAAGLTHLPVWKVMLATGVGMTPMCFAQAYLADNLLQRFSWLIYPLLAVCVVYVLIVFRIVLKMRRKKLAPASVD